MKVRSQSSRLSLITLPPPPMPALLNSRWMWSVSWSRAVASGLAELAEANADAAQALSRLTRFTV